MVTIKLTYREEKSEWPSIRWHAGYDKDPCHQHGCTPREGRHHPLRTRHASCTTPAFPSFLPHSLPLFLRFYLWGGAERERQADSLGVRSPSIRGSVASEILPEIWTGMMKLSHIPQENTEAPRSKVTCPTSHEYVEENSKPALPPEAQLSTWEEDGLGARIQDDCEPHPQAGAAVAGGGALAEVPHDTCAPRPAHVTTITTEIHLAASGNSGSFSESYQFFIPKNSTRYHK